MNGYSIGRRRRYMPLTLREAALRAFHPITSLLVQTLIVRGAKTTEGQLIEAVAIPWFDIIDLLSKDPKIAFEIPPDRWEEIIAGAYRKSGIHIGCWRP